jgi:hypothetical protein
MGQEPDPVKRTRRRTATTRSEDAIASHSAADRDRGVAETGDTTEEIREDIEATRAQMSGTIDEIQARLSPRRLVDDAKETVRDATVGKAREVMSNASDSAGGLVERVRDNPLPAALIGIGAWWLFGSKRSTSYDRTGYRDRSGSAYETEYARHGGSRAVDWGRSSEGGFVHTLKDHPIPASLAGMGLAWWLVDRQRRPGGSGSSYREYSAGQSGYGDYGSQGRGAASRVGNMASEATETMSEYAEEAQERIGAYADRAQETMGEYADRAQTEFDRLLRENPFALGAAAVLVGAAFGMAIPETNAEQQVIGGMRDQMMEKAQAAAQGAVDKVQEAVSHLPEGAKPGSR